VTRETRVSRTGSALRRNVDLQGGLVHADLGALTVAGGRLLHFHPAHSPVITNQTSPHVAETLPPRVTRHERPAPTSSLHISDTDKSYISSSTPSALPRTHTGPRQLRLPLRMKRRRSLYARPEIIRGQQCTGGASRRRGLPHRGHQLPCARSSRDRQGGRGVPQVVESKSLQASARVAGCHTRRLKLLRRRSRP
jgi:hypothetical protein